MKKIVSVLFFATVIFLSSCHTKVDNKDCDLSVNIDMNSKKAEIPTSMYGVFFEEINHAGDGGLYAEMLMNRSFEECTLPQGYTVKDGELISPPVKNHITGEMRSGKYRWGTDPCPGWSLSNTTDASMEVSEESPNFKTAPHSLKITIKKPKGISVINSGYWGIALKKGDNYKLRMFASTPKQYTGNITVKLVGANGKILASKIINTKNDGKWNEYKETLTASDTTTMGKLYLYFNAQGTVRLDYVSLFPEKTFKGRENGMRTDIAQILADLHPAFVRWPGGCIVEGITYSNRVKWKESLGDPAARSGEYDTWGYRNTYGFGYKEYLDFIEDIGAKGMFVCNVGLGCQYRTGDACSDKDVDGFLQDALDAIEYAIGDVSTPWGSVRAKAGHPKPYPLSYVEIGNENWGDLYNKRFDIFYSAIKAKYPQLTLISNHSLGDAVNGVKKTDMIDPHWYVDPNFFFKNTAIFDAVQRKDYKIYVGEYACNVGVGAGNMQGALSEAAFISGMERNSDLVNMASYAPLFENVNDRVWPTNLILFNNNQVYGRSSYYVQKLFAENRPTYNLADSCKTTPETEAAISGNGYVGFGTWETQSEFKNLRLTDSKGKVMMPDMKDASQWQCVSGDWSAKDGSYSQTGKAQKTALIWKKEKFSEGTIEFEAQKLSGKEGFLCYFGLHKLDVSEGKMLNVAGWGNTSSGFQGLGNNSDDSKRLDNVIENNHWYKIKIVVSKMKAEYYLDGKLMLTYKSTPINKKFVIAGFDKAANEVVVKVINGTNKVSRGRINLNGGDVESEGTVITLAANSPTDENSFKEPTKISPIKTEFEGFSKSFVYEFKPNSLTIFRIKRK